MSERMLTDSERETLEALKKKAKFENSLVRAIEKTIYGLHLYDKTKKEMHEELRSWFLKHSGYWQKKNLTESEFYHALKLLRNKKRPRGY